MNNVWSNISSWFKNETHREDVMREFNIAARASYINGEVPYQLKCVLSMGNINYKHPSSAWPKSGIRIVVMTDDLLSDLELNKIGLSVLADSRIVRMLITLGWDTLEVISKKDKVGFQWKLINYTN